MLLRILVEPGADRLTTLYPHTAMLLKERSIGESIPKHPNSRAHEEVIVGGSASPRGRP